MCRTVMCWSNKWGFLSFLVGQLGRWVRNGSSTMRTRPQTVIADVFICRQNVSFRRKPIWICPRTNWLKFTGTPRSSFKSSMACKNLFELCEYRYKSFCAEPSDTSTVYANIRRLKKICTLTIHRNCPHSKKSPCCSSEELQCTKIEELWRWS